MDSKPAKERRFYEPRPNETPEEKQERERLTAIVRQFVRQGTSLHRFLNEPASGASGGGETKVKMDTLSDNFQALVDLHGPESVVGILVDGGVAEADAMKYVAALRSVSKLRKI